MFLLAQFSCLSVHVQSSLERFFTQCRPCLLKENCWQISSLQRPFQFIVLEDCPCSQRSSLFTKVVLVYKGRPCSQRSSLLLKVVLVHKGRPCSQRSSLFTKVVLVHKGRPCSQMSFLFTKIVLVIKSRPCSQRSSLLSLSPFWFKILFLFLLNPMEATNATPYANYIQRIAALFQAPELPRRLLLLAQLQRSHEKNRSRAGRRVFTDFSN